MEQWITTIIELKQTIPTAPTDEELVKAAKAGDLKAFDALVQKYFTTVYLVAQSRLRQRESAEDLTQEVFLRAFLHLDDFRPPYRFAAWVVQITRNLAVNQVRQNHGVSSLIRMSPLENLPPEALISKQKGTREMIETSERNETLTRAIYSLPARQREILLLRYVEELNDREIAERLDLHPSTVGRQMKTALAALKETLEPMLEEWGPARRPSAQSAHKVMALIAATAALSLAERSALAAVCGVTAKGTGLGGMSELFRNCSETIFSLWTAAKWKLITLGAAGVLAVVALFSVRAPVSERLNVPASAPAASISLSAVDLDQAQGVFSRFQATCRNRNKDAAASLWDFDRASRFQRVHWLIPESWIEQTFSTGGAELDSLAAAKIQAISRLTTHFNFGPFLMIEARADAWRVRCALNKVNENWKLVYFQIVPLETTQLPAPAELQAIQGAIAGYQTMCRESDLQGVLAAWDTEWLARTWDMTEGDYARRLRGELEAMMRAGEFDEVGQDRISMIKNSPHEKEIVEAEGRIWQWKWAQAKSGWKIVQQEKILRRY